MATRYFLLKDRRHCSYVKKECKKEGENTIKNIRVKINVHSERGGVNTSARKKRYRNAVSSCALIKELRERRSGELPSQK
jgi:hypothetical protein